MIWDIAELATRFGRKWKAGIHPGAHVAISLFIWLGAAIVGGGTSDHVFRPSKNVDHCRFEAISDTRSRKQIDEDSSIRDQAVRSAFRMFSWYD